MREKAKALMNPLPEMAGTISNAYLFRLLFFVSVESPLAPSLGHPLPRSCSPLFIPFTHSAGRDTRLRGCYTSAPTPGFLEGTGLAETMRGPEGLNVYGWVALAPPLPRRLFGSLQPAGPHGEGWCPRCVPAPRRFWLPGPPPCVLPTGGWMGLPEAGSALQGLPSHPLGSQVLLPPGPVGWSPFPGPQETGRNEYLLRTRGHLCCNSDRPWACWGLQGGLDAWGLAGAGSSCTTSSFKPQSLLWTELVVAGMN